MESFMKKTSALIFIIMLIVSCGGGGSTTNLGPGSGVAPTGNLKSQVDLVGTT